jgi:hypothetical protein
MHSYDTQLEPSTMMQASIQSRTTSFVLATSFGQHTHHMSALTCTLSTCIAHNLETYLLQCVFLFNIRIDPIVFLHLFLLLCSQIDGSVGHQ